MMNNYGLTDYGFQHPLFVVLAISFLADTESPPTKSGSASILGLVLHAFCIPLFSLSIWKRLAHSGHAILSCPD
jgi:hypothetical protein